MEDIDGFVLEKVEKMLKEDMDSLKKIGNCFWPVDFGDQKHFGPLRKITTELYRKEYGNFKEKFSNLSRKRATNSEIAKAFKSEIDQLQKTCAFYKALANYLAFQFKKAQKIERFAEKKSVNF